MKTTKGELNFFSSLPRNKPFSLLRHRRRVVVANPPLIKFIAATGGKKCCIFFGNFTLHYIDTQILVQVKVCNFVKAEKEKLFRMYRFAADVSVQIRIYGKITLFFTASVGQ
jgi:hypothetical protein